MKHKIYRSLLSKDISKTKTKDISYYQLPIAFTSFNSSSLSDSKIELETGEVKLRYFEYLLEPNRTEKQTIPLLTEYSYKELLKIKKRLIRRNEHILDRLTLLKRMSVLDNFLILELRLELLNNYNKLLDIFPSHSLIEKTKLLLKDIKKKYPELDDFDTYEQWMTTYTTKINGKILELLDTIKNKIFLDNYKRLDLSEYPGEFPNGYVLQNRLAFSDFMKKMSLISGQASNREIINYSKIGNRYKLEKITLSKQQKFVSDYLNRNTPYRGLLLYHGLGSGKSGASISITNGYINKKVVILLPASLKTNYLQEIQKFGESSFKSTFNWVFYKLPINKDFELCNWIFTNIIKNIESLSGEWSTFSQVEYEKVSNFNTLTSNKDILLSLLINNIIKSLKNTLCSLLIEIGVPSELIRDAYSLDEPGIWLIDNSFIEDDIIVDKHIGKFFKITRTDGDSSYAVPVTKSQFGGGKCKLCGSEGTTVRSCPLNDIPDEKKNYKKHPLAVQLLATEMANEASGAADKVATDVKKFIDSDGTSIASKKSSSKLGEIHISSVDKINYQYYNISRTYSSEEKSSICSQIKKCFKYSYSLCSYNAGAYTVINLLQKLIPNFNTLVGDKKTSQITNSDINKVLSLIYMEEIENPFSNKVVVIDEVHNLVSLIMPNESVNFNGSIIYELLMRAQNANLVCLSGTPSINNIFEFSILYNLINGFIKTFNFNITSKDALISVDSDKINDFFKKNKYIDRFKFSHGTLELTRLPNGFVKTFDESGEYIGVEYNKIMDISDKDFIIFLTDICKEEFPYYIIDFDKYSTFTLFKGIIDNTKSSKGEMIGDMGFISQQIEQFYTSYVGTGDNLIYERTFKNNISGLTSFYNERKTDADGTNIFPEVIIQENNIEFSMYQFIQYCYAREEERKREKIAKISRFSNKDGGSMSASFKTTTRQLSIFTFPPNILRPTKKNLYDRVYILDEIETILQQIIANEEPSDTLDLVHIKIWDKIRNMHYIKESFISYILRQEYINRHIEALPEANVLFLDYLHFMKSNPSDMDEMSDEDDLEDDIGLLEDVSGVKNELKQVVRTDSSFEIQILTHSVVIEKVIHINKDFITRLSQEIIDHIDAELESLKSSVDKISILKGINVKMNDVYLSMNIELDKDDIFIDTTADGEYNQILERQISRIADSEIYLNLTKVFKNTPYNLKWLSPKYFNIFNNLIHSPGPVFIYSQFLTAEGIGIFTKVLENNGFSELKWSKKYNASSDTNSMEPEDNGICNIITNKKTTKGSFNNKRTFSEGTMIRWTHKNSEGKLISTTHKIIHKKKKYIMITQSTELNEIFKHDDVDDYSDSELIKIKESKYSDISPCRFVLWTGKQTDNQERVDILNFFNNPKNKLGSECLILLATASGAEGISLKNVRQVHIMEPYWNNVRTNQVIGRARRVRSHSLLPEEDRKVDVFKYVSRFSDVQLNGLKIKNIDDDIVRLIADLSQLKSGNKGVKKGKKESASDETENLEKFINLMTKFTSELHQYDNSLSTDEELERVAKKKAKLLNKFLHIIKESAVDCTLNLEENKQSDPLLLGDLECHNPDITRDGLEDNDGYIYNLNPCIISKNSLDRDLQKESKSLREASTKYQVIKFRVSNEEIGIDSVKLKCIIFPRTTTKKQSNIPNNTILYNYFSYFNINPLDDNELVEIGKYVDSSLILQADFIKNIKLFKLMNECDDEVKTTSPEYKADIKYNLPMLQKFSDLVYKCYYSKLEEEQIFSVKKDKKVASTKWICPLCDTINKKTDDECTNPLCDMEQDDL